MSYTTQSREFSSSRLVPMENNNGTPLPPVGQRPVHSSLLSRGRQPLQKVDRNMGSRASHRRNPSFTPPVNLNNLREEEEPEKNSGPRSHQLAEKLVIRRALASGVRSKAKQRVNSLLNATQHPRRYIGSVPENNENYPENQTGGSRKRTVKRNKNKRNSRKRTNKRTNRRHVRK